MQRKFIFITVLLFVILSLSFSFVFISHNAFAEDDNLENELDFSMINDINLEQFEDIIDNYDTDNLFSGSFKDFVLDLSKEGQIDIDGLINLVLKTVFSSLNNYLPFFVTLLIIFIAFGALSQMKDGYLSEEIQSVINVVIMITILLLLLVSINKIILDSKQCMLSLKNQMYVGFPIIITLLHGIGAQTTAISMQPILYFMSVIVTDVLIGIVFPIFIFSIAISSISAVSSNLKLNKFIEFLKSISKTIIGTTLTVFTACVALSGISANVHDSIMYKTAKYAVGNSVPMIGSYLKDGMDIIIMSGILLKNAIGIGALIVFFITVLSPVIAVFAFSSLLKLVTAISENFLDGKIISSLSAISKSVSEIGVALLAVTYMYVISVFVLLIAGNNFI